MGDVMTAPTAAAATKVELEIPCECGDYRDHGPSGCGQPAEVWAIIHDVCDDCRKYEDGNASLYLCSECWQRFSASIDGTLVFAAKTRQLAQCETCLLPIRRRTDVIRRVVGIRGTKR
jgi:hypothetical protein